MEDDVTTKTSHLFQRRAADPPPPSSASSPRKESSYTSTHPKGLRGL